MKIASALVIVLLCCVAFGSPVSEIYSNPSTDDEDGHMPSSWRPRMVHSIMNDIKAARLRQQDPNLAQQNGFTPLHMAVKLGQLDMIRWFIESGVNLNAQTGNGLTPLVLSIMNNQEEVAMLLLNAGSEPLLRSGMNGWTAVHYAVSSSFARKLFQKLAEMGINLNLRDNFGNTPLMLAIENENRQVLSIFRDFPRLDWDQMNDVGETALHIAAMRHSLDYLQRLLWAGANPNIGRAHDGFTPLHICASECQVKCVRILLTDPRIRTDILDAEGYSASQRVPETEDCLDVEEEFALHYHARRKTSASQPDFLKDEGKFLGSRFMPASRLSDSTLPKSDHTAKRVQSSAMTTKEKTDYFGRAELDFAFPVVSPSVKDAPTPRNPFPPSLRRTTSLHAHLQRHSSVNLPQNLHSAWSRERSYRQHSDFRPLDVRPPHTRPEEMAQVTAGGSSAFHPERSHSGSVPRDIVVRRRKMVVRDGSPGARYLDRLASTSPNPRPSDRLTSTSPNPHPSDRLPSPSPARSIGVRRTREEANSIQGGSGSALDDGMVVAEGNEAAGWLDEMSDGVAMVVEEEEEQVVPGKRMRTKAT